MISRLAAFPGLMADIIIILNAQEPDGRGGRLASGGALDFMVVVAESQEEGGAETVGNGFHLRAVSTVR